MLPPPTISFTIPSIEDDLPIACRIYHPTSLSPGTIAQLSEKQWKKRAAIVAHPYAPLGGCYDDPVVNIVANAMLKDGYVVGTFNFRGAGDSKGHTSWQSKAEQNDYISFLVFMIYYVHHLTLPQISRPSSSSSSYDLTPVPSHQVPPVHEPQLPYNPTNPIQRLVIGGYSYGALIATFLPSSMRSIIEPFQSPPPVSAHAEIRLRAARLAFEQSSDIEIQINTLLAQARERQRGRTFAFREDGIKSPKTRQISGVRVGGEEDLRRASHDASRPRTSFNLHETPERVRKSIDRVRSLARERNRHGSASSYTTTTSPTKQPRRTNSSIANSSSESVDSLATPNVQEENGVKPIVNLVTTLRPAYLLISPPINHLGSLATLWSSSSRARQAETHEKLVSNPSLALFGDSDGFVSVRRFRAWAEKLRTDGGQNFKYKEIHGAGHFLSRREDGKVLKDEIMSWASDL